MNALDTLKPADITIVESMKNPPSQIKLVLECVLKGLKPEAQGKMYDDYWDASQKILGSLKTFDKDNIPVPVIKEIRERYISDRDFVPEKIKADSSAYEGLCQWIRAMDDYGEGVIKTVGPKKAAQDAQFDVNRDLDLEGIQKPDDGEFQIFIRAGKFNIPYQGH